MSVDVFTRRHYIQGLANILGAAMMSRKLRAANQNVAYGEATIPSGIRSRFVNNINGLTVHMLEAGFDNNDRPCILLLHGFPELAYSWRKIMPPLASACLSSLRDSEATSRGKTRKPPVSITQS